MLTEADKNDIAEKVWNRYKAYGIDGKANTTFGQVMSVALQAGQRVNDGSLAIAVCDQVWKRYKVYDERGNLVPLLTAIQVIFQDVENLSPAAFSAEVDTPAPSSVTDER